MRDKTRRKFVCVKIIKIKNIPKKERDATKMEVDLLRRLHHPNIVRYIDSFLSNNNESLCISMEYCDGGDLASQIKNARRKLFSEDKVLHWFVQISLGLHYMHSNKVLHRDLKTQNIFLLGNGRLVLGDLGISKVLEGTMDFAQTCIGTPYYMSPEIFKNKPYSYKSDVWALGCVLYEMTTLNHAFDANSINGLAQKIIKGKYPPIHNKYSRYLRELIAQMLAPEPKQRPDLDQILRKPFIRKHVLSFFVEIASRPSASLGEGPMIVRAAASGGIGGAVVNDANAIALRQQLEVLGMQKELQDALNPKAAPADPLEAQKMAKEQATQLRREEEHRKMVEAALERLRLERESRARERASGGAVAGAPSKISAAAVAPSAPQRDLDLPGSKFPAQVQRAPPPVPSGVRDGGGIAPSAYPPRRDPASEQRRLNEERVRLEAEADERRQQQRRDLEAHQRAEQRAQAAEEMLKQKREAALKAQAERDQLMKREQQRLAERERQNAEIEQLKIFKDEMDRKQKEKDMITERRRQEERRKIEEYRRSGSEVAEDFREVPVGRPPRVTRESSYSRAEDKEEYSAREKVMQRKLEKQAREDMERIEALKEVADENRRIRAQAYEQHRNIWHGNNGAPVAAAPTDETVRAGARVRSRSPIVAEDKSPGYQFEAEGRARRNVSSGLDMEEMTVRLNEVAPASSR
jgi:non-specific serine/threonine protein kinase/NIMA (never in mitosis gene a)-related kinase